MTRELGATARSLVAVAREGISPDAGAAARVRARVAASVAGTAGTAGVVAATTKAAAALPSASVASTSIVLKVAGTLALVGAALVGTTIASRHRASPTAAAITDTHRPATGRPGSDCPGSDCPGSDCPGSDCPGSDCLGSDCPKSGRPGASATPDCPKSGRPAGGHPTSAGHPSLAREVELVDRAMAALRLGHAADALATVAVFNVETAGHGQLAEDAAALEIEARCQLREPVTQQLDAFDRRWPGSAQRAHLTAACSH